jgi:hypothetical protein
VAMENDAQQADIALRAGLETTHQVQEHTTDAIPLYTAGEGTPGEMRRPKRWTPRSRRLRPKKQQRRRPTRRGGGYTRHIAKRGRSSTSGDKPSGTRRSANGGSSKGGGCSQRPSCKCRPEPRTGGETHAAESEEDFCNDTVTMNWMPLLFDAMLGPDTHPDVKRMALERQPTRQISTRYTTPAPASSNGTPSSPNTGSDRYCGSGTIRASLPEAHSGSPQRAPRR